MSKKFFSVLYLQLEGEFVYKTYVNEDEIECRLCLEYIWRKTVGDGLPRLDDPELEVFIVRS